MSASAPISEEFKNSIPKQPSQSAPLTPSPVFSPYKNSISRSQSPLKVPVELLPASDQFKNPVHCINPLPSPPTNPPKNPKVKDRKTTQLSLKPPPKLLPAPDPLENSTSCVRPLPSLTNPLRNLKVKKWKAVQLSPKPPRRLLPAPDAFGNLIPNPPPRLLPGPNAFGNSIPHIRPLSSSVKKKKAVQLSPKPPPRLLPAPDAFQNSIPRIRPLPSSSANPPRLLPAPDAFGNSMPRIRPLPSLSANPPDHPKLKKRRLATDTRISEALKLAVGLLKEEFDLRKRTSQKFPPEISYSHIRSSVSKYENEMSIASKISICCSCGGFATTGNIHKINDQDNLILEQRHSFDQCGYHECSWHFCSVCYTALMHHTIPKFSAANFVNVTMCQHYPYALEDLTVVEECLIAKCHPVGTILKLRPGGHSTPANYNALRGHMIVIPQDPGPLLQILPNPELKLNNLIKVFWLSKHPPTNRDLKPFLQVRKDKVLTALHYLVQHNHLYHHLTINHTVIENWPHDFIPHEITDNIICLTNLDHHEREGYTVSLETGNYENDLQVAQDEAFHANENDPLITGSVYTDINGERTNPNVQMIDALLELVTSSSSQPNETIPGAEDERQQRQRDVPLISYAIRGQATLLSSWEDPSYFTGAFPTLFPTGVGGHLDQRPIEVSLKAFAQWALNHHSKRFLSLSNTINLY